MSPMEPKQASADGNASAASSADAPITRQVRQQAAVVRALLDELDRLMPPGESAAVAAQLTEELALLAEAMRSLGRQAA